VWGDTPNFVQALKAEKEPEKSDYLAKVCSEYERLLNLQFYRGSSPAVRARSHVLTGALFPGFTFLGSATRVVVYKNKNVLDSAVQEWMQHSKIEFKHEYKMCVSNTEAMRTSIAKYNRAQPLLDPVAWGLAGEYVERHFGPWLGGSIEITRDAAKNKAERMTSPGYPFSLKWQKKGDFLDDPISDRVLDAHWDKLATDSPIVSFWTASLKLELRPIEKIAVNSQRTFTASAADGSINTNRLCLDFNEAFYRSNNKHWSFVGCSKFSGGWDRLYRRLSRHPNAFELDESSFDASLFRAALRGMQEFRWRMLAKEYRTPDNAKRLENMYDSIIHSVIVLDNGEVVMKHTGNPSGSANTIVDNTIILFRLFAYAWVVMSAEHDRAFNTNFCNYRAFMGNVEAALNGDDNTFTCSDAVVGWFNPTTISKVWTGIGVVTTTPCEEPRQLENVQFLSHGFTKVRGWWLPIPDREKVLCSLLYASEYNDPAWTLMRCSALRLESWADPKLREELVDLQQFLYRNYASSVTGERDVQALKLSNIRALWKTDEAIWRLYTIPRYETTTVQLQAVGSQRMRILRIRRAIRTKAFRCHECGRRYRALVSRNGQFEHQDEPIEFQCGPCDWADARSRVLDWWNFAYSADFKRAGDDVKQGLVNQFCSGQIEDLAGGLHIVRLRYRAGRVPSHDHRDSTLEDLNEDYTEAEARMPLANPVNCVPEIAGYQWHEPHSQAGQAARLAYEAFNARQE